MNEPENWCWTSKVLNFFLGPLREPSPAAAGELFENIKQKKTDLLLKQDKRLKATGPEQKDTAKS